MSSFLLLLAAPAFATDEVALTPQGVIIDNDVVTEIQFAVVEGRAGGFAGLTAEQVLQGEGFAARLAYDCVADSDAAELVCGIQAEVRTADGVRTWESAGDALVIWAEGYSLDSAVPSEGLLDLIGAAAAAFGDTEELVEFFGRQ